MNIVQSINDTTTYLKPRSRCLLGMSVSDLAVYIAIVASALLECSCFFLTFLPSGFFKLCNYNTKYLTALMALVGAFGAAVYMRKNSSRPLFAIPVAAFVAMCAVLAIVSAEYYGANALTMLIRALPFIAVPLLYFALHAGVENERIYTFMIDVFVWVAAVYAFLCLVQAAGINLMDASHQIIGYRDNRTRIIMSGDFVAFGAVLSLGRCFSSPQRRKINFTLFLLMLFELYYVAQTRFLLIGIVVCAAFGFVVSGKSRFLKVLLVLVAVILAASQFSDELTAVIFPSELSLSTVARQNAYTYYWDHMRDLGLFGIGYLPSDASGDMFGVVYFGSTARGDITDIGVVGYLARYGVAGALVLMLGVAALAKGFIRRDKSSFSLNRNVEAWMLLAFYVSISPTMTLSDSQRIFYLPILALLLEHAFVSRSAMRGDSVE